MATISFKADDEFKRKLELLAHKKGINTSAYIKLILTQSLNDELSRVTENGLTVLEELNVLAEDTEKDASGPFSSASSLIKALSK